MIHTLTSHIRVKETLTAVKQPIIAFQNRTSSATIGKDG